MRPGQQAAAVRPAAGDRRRRGPAAAQLGQLRRAGRHDRRPPAFRARRRRGGRDTRPRPPWPPRPRAAAAAGRPIRSVVVTLPDNPTGRLAPPGHVRALCEVAAAHGWSSSATRSTATWSTTRPPRSLSPAQAAPERTVITTGLSKSLALGGWRIGVARMPDGPLGRGLRGPCSAPASEIWSAPAAPVQQAAALAFAEPPAITERIARQPAPCTPRSPAPSPASAPPPGCPSQPPQAGFYVYPDFGPWRDHLRARHQVTTAPPWPGCCWTATASHPARQRVRRAPRRAAAAAGHRAALRRQPPSSKKQHSPPPTPPPSPGSPPP